jgi:Protein of unknown function (DUF2530)
VERNAATSDTAGQAGRVETSTVTPADQAAAALPGTATVAGPDQEVPPPATLAPLPYDGVRSVTAGTVLWLVALVVMIPLAGDLRRDGHLWWLATAACGFGLGLVGLVIVIRRRARLRRSETAGSA